MNLLVVGAGAMGRWFAESTRDEFDDVAFVDTDETAARDAADALDGRVASPDGDDAFDLVCIAVPLPAAPTVIEAYADRVDGASCDVTGSMVGPVAAMEEHCPDAERVSLHPLFAPENAPGTVAIVESTDGSITARVRDALLAAGNRLAETTPEEHDEAMETVQARAHAAVLAFGLAAESVPAKFQTPISAGLFDLLAQVTDGDPRVYSDIQEAFDGAEDVAEAASELAEADEERFAELYERAR